MKASYPKRQTVPTPSAFHGGPLPGWPSFSVMRFINLVFTAWPAVMALVLMTIASVSQAAGWSPIRTASGTSGWQQVVCDNANNGWSSCEMPLNIVLSATPPSIAATGEQSNIVATVTDYAGNNVGANLALAWTTSDGTLSTASTLTDANGQAAVTLTASHSIGGATVIATATTETGSGSIYVPFTDKWVAIAPVYSAWVNYGSPYSCSAWSPDPSTVPSGTTYTQSATCYQNQQAYQQNREQSAVTGQVRNAGAATPIYQTVQVTVNQQAVGTKAVAPQCYHYSSWKKDGVNSNAWVQNSPTERQGNPNAFSGTFRLFMNSKVIAIVANRTDKAVVNGVTYSIGSIFYTLAGTEHASGVQQSEYCIE